MEENKEEKKGTIYWHSAFCAAHELTLRDYRDILEYIPEYELGKRPLKMDILVVKKKNDCQIADPIASFYKKHNIVDYKSPDDNLSIDDVYKAIGYACIYKSLADHVDDRRIEDMTISMFRHSKPRKALKQLESLRDVSVVPENIGIYRIDGMFTIPIRIIVTSEISGGYEALRLLSKQLSIDVFKRFIETTQDYSEQGDIERVKSVLEVFMEANKQLLLEIKGDIGMMGPALREFMHDDLEAAMNQGIEIGIEQKNEQVVEAIISTCKKLNGSFMDAVEMVMLNTGMDQESAETMVKKHWS